MGQCFSNADHMQKIAKCEQNIKMSLKVNVWKGAQCYASHLQIFTRQVRWQKSVNNNISLVTIIVSGIGISKWDFFKRYKMNR